LFNFLREINIEQAQYKQLMASLEGLTEAQLDELCQVLRQRQEADGVQRLIKKARRQGQRRRWHREDRCGRGGAARHPSGF